jgi:thiamine biosynthesis lipoprotein
VSKRELQTAIELDQLAVATSGNYRQYREHEGKRYGHSLNPKTGYPEATGILSVTVIHPQCMYADAWATAFMMMPLREAVKMAEQNTETEAMFITGSEDDGFDVHYSSGFEKFIP